MRDKPILERSAEMRCRLFLRIENTNHRPLMHLLCLAKGREFLVQCDSVAQGALIGVMTAGSLAIGPAFELAWNPMSPKQAGVVCHV